MKGSTASLLLILAFATFSPSADAQTDDERLAASRELATQFQQDLGGRLSAAMASGGPVEAIAVCSQEAPAIADRLSVESGASVRRIALATRNPTNAADAQSIEVLDGFARALSAGVEGPLEHVQAQPDGSIRYTRAIVTQPMCLVCHGQAIADDVATVLAQHYPADQATGLQVGVLRGAFLIEWPGKGDGKR